MLESNPSAKQSLQDDGRELSDKHPPYTYVYIILENPKR
jgi:hypothetical protein